MGKDLNELFTKENKQISDKHMKRSYASWLLRKI
jgi:hypothetical protein